MWSHDTKLHNADVVAVFDDQLDADEAVLQLRISGFRDDQIGYYSQNQSGVRTNFLERDFEVLGVILGALTGAALGIGAALALSDWWAMRVGVGDPLGLAITLAVFGALLVGYFGAWIGMSYSRRGVDAPAIDMAVGPFVLAVHAGDAQEEVRSIIRRKGGHEVPPGALMPTPAT